MPGYQAQLPSLAEMMARMKAKRAAQRGGQPADASVPALPSIDEMRMRMQQRQAQPGQVTGVTVGTPQMPPQYQMTVGQPQMPPQMTVGTPYNRQMTTEPIALQPDPRGERVKQLMAQGMTYEQAMRAVQSG